MSILDYFRTTNKGIIPMEQLPNQSFVTKSFFGLSLGLEIVLMLMFIGFFAMAVFRSVKKIKNPKFKTESQEEQSQQGSQNAEEKDGKQTNDNLIYRFDEEDHEKQKKLDGDEDEAKVDTLDQNSEEQYDKQHDENEDRFLQIDAQIMFFQPFLIGHVVCVNAFASDYISLICIIVSAIMFFVFNIKNMFSNVKLLSMAFMLPALASFIPFFIWDHDMST